MRYSQEPTNANHALLIVLLSGNVISAQGVINESGQRENIQMLWYSTVVYVA